MSYLDRISLRQRVLKAGGWSLAGYGLSQAIRFGTNLLLTRLLAPEMFGVMAIAVIMMLGLAMFSDVGLRQNVVQSGRGNDPAFLNTAWTIQILRGVVLWFFALCVSLLVYLAIRIGVVPKDSVYANPVLPDVIAVLSVTAIIGAFQSTKLFEASRGLSLFEVTKIEIVGQIAGLLCMLGWAAVDRSIWVLVAGSICSSLVTVLLSHVWLPGVSNRWEWDRSALREIFHFGKWIFLSSILFFLVNSGDRLLLGALVNTTALGVYVIAFSLFSSVELVLTKVIADVTFPALSEVVRERPTELQASYYRLHVVIASFAYFCSGILMISGQMVISTLYDNRYNQAGWMLEVLAIALLTSPLHLAGQCFLALGAPRLLSILIATRLIALFVCLPIGFHFFGLSGALAGIVFSYFSSMTTTIFYRVKFGLFNLRKELYLIPVIVVGMIIAKAFNLMVGY
jgi:O-antigen/teichoic acid export membrane protein